MEEALWDLKPINNNVLNVMEKAYLQYKLIYIKKLI